MNAPPFDTCAAVIALRGTGLDEAQAEAIVNTVRDANTASREDLATKADIAILKAELASAVNRMLLAQVAIAGALFAALELFP